MHGMKQVLIPLVFLAGACATAATPAANQAAPQPTAAASAPGGECARERVSTVLVNGKEVQVRRKVRPAPDCPKPAAAKLWD
jgi:hypothetical protein